MSPQTPNPVTIEVEFQIVSIRCGQCGKTEWVRTDDEANAFLAVHGQHERLVYQAMIAAPANMVDGRLIDLQFLPAVTS